MDDETKTFEDLKCWKACREFKIWASRLAAKFPVEERYSLKSQLIRSSRSSTANIAEGYGRFHYQETIQFCRQSRGSLYESLDHLITARDDNYINDKALAAGRELINNAIKLVNGYIRYLAKRKSE
jgi:four helix bundle protein